MAEYEECKDMKRREGLVMESRDNDANIVNHIYEYSLERPLGTDYYETVILDRTVFMQCRPKDGRFKLVNSFPLGTRLSYYRSREAIFSYKVLGSFNFNLVRGVRGVNQNRYLCHMDLLDLTIPIDDKGSNIPPGVTFQCSLHFELRPTLGHVKEIKWLIESIDRVSFETISFDTIPWPKRGIQTYQPEPDYNRKFEALAYLPRTLLVYVGHHWFVTHRDNMPFARLGFHHKLADLKPGKFYVSHLIQSGLDQKVYTYLMIRDPLDKDGEFDKYREPLYKRAQRVSPYKLADFRSAF